MTRSFPTRQKTPPDRYLPPWDDGRMGYRNSAYLCDALVGFDGVVELLCANTAVVAWVDEEFGTVLYRCAGHVPSTSDEDLWPRSADWDGPSDGDLAYHRLTGCSPVALERCPSDVAERATAVAVRLRHLQSTVVEPYDDRDRTSSGRQSGESRERGDELDD